MDTKMNSEWVKEQEEMVLSLCICQECPSWVECGEKGGYCFGTIGKSECIFEEKGCICLGCPVADKSGLEFMYYCTQGSAKEQEK
ncbi:MAG: DUF2769 domain-containing protein [Methanosarcinaceae archaeon]|nr:DUF2769 domain-containing protein [Methanosarcinaceae archaeon]MDD4331949.1 DUF2769 domain-containing protein [Methanosarcinaceae archaeon]MDD4749499.1 DUF2769 domain-containing protein [Methanosarcinaceae archaeon]